MHGTLIARDVRFIPRKKNAKKLRSHKVMIRPQRLANYRNAQITNNEGNLKIVLAISRVTLHGDAKPVASLSYIFRISNNKNIEQLLPLNIIYIHKNK